MIKRFLITKSYCVNETLSLNEAFSLNEVFSPVRADYIMSLRSLLSPSGFKGRERNFDVALDFRIFSYF